MTTANKDHVQLLFKHKAGRVNLRIIGPRIGWAWRRIEFFRWKPSAKNPTEWDKVPLFSADDLPHLEQCIKAARAWSKEDTQQ